MEIEKSKRNLLIVDDEPEIVDILANFATRYGWTFETALDGEAALGLLQQFDFFAILSDISMPKLTGIELLRHANTLKIASPVIFLTAYDSSNQVKEALRLGAFDFLAKPFDREELATALARAIEYGKRNLRLQLQVANLMALQDDNEQYQAESKMLGLLKANHHPKKKTG